MHRHSFRSPLPESREQFATDIANCNCNTNWEQGSSQFKYSAISLSAHKTSKAGPTSPTRQLGCSWWTVQLPASHSVRMIVDSKSSLARSVPAPSAFSGG
jgi:hypothetical protein